MTFYMCFVYIFVITCTIYEIQLIWNSCGKLKKILYDFLYVSEILAQIDHKGQRFSTEQFLMFKITKNAKSDLSYLKKGPLKQFNHIHLLRVHWYPPWEAFCVHVHREKVIEQFFNKWPIHVYVKMGEK